MATSAQQQITEAAGRNGWTAKHPSHSLTNEYRKGHVIVVVGFSFTGSLTQVTVTDQKAPHGTPFGWGVSHADREDLNETLATLAKK
ncbi:hypothetical protein [Amycolatopsis sp. DSM 110486]|uniref:hypothetical protein n=1 Tax=Amycolatopsis sp. DSM 110486 TaxID=2865832 RepID=UPI001C6A13E3|nr:hypothetical protein [Amycolatopsis sp. DSM 110486]QYN17588.1 hypothetical protein K1T34_32910 [Amycolatopsis sp. DSM 110486]